MAPHPPTPWPWQKSAQEPSACRPTMVARALGARRGVVLAAIVAAANVLRRVVAVPGEVAVVPVVHLVDAPAGLAQCPTSTRSSLASRPSSARSSAAAAVVAVRARALRVDAASRLSA